MSAVSSSDDERDDFSEKTKDLLAKRAGYLCSYPGCKRMTVAGSEDRKSRLTMTGVAAHITAAAEKGPRYDELMSPEERAGETNGIWTCQIHGKFIDDNPSKCTVEEISRWKAQHEKWVFDRVESGVELFNKGIYQLKFRNVGVFKGQYKVPFGRHNILVAENEAGKTTFAEILSAFSGGMHWTQFNHRFDFSKNLDDQTYIEASRQDDTTKVSVRLSPQTAYASKKKSAATRRRVQINVNGSPAIDWPREGFKVIYFERQLYRTHYNDPKDTFIKALRYLATVLGTTEDLIWGSLREDLFVDSMFGYRFRRTGHRRVDVRVPDGRSFYLHHEVLSFTEQQMAFLDIALKLVAATSNKVQWVYVFDTGFFQRLDQVRKIDLFKKLVGSNDDRIQTLFCLNSEEDAEVLKEVNLEKWVNAEKFGELTLHSFL
jgi:hypothetical protein